jgi:hypothetical protein
MDLESGYEYYKSRGVFRTACKMRNLRENFPPPLSSLKLRTALTPSNLSTTRMRKLRKLIVDLSHSVDFEIDFPTFFWRFSHSIPCIREFHLFGLCESVIHFPVEIDFINRVLPNLFFRARKLLQFVLGSSYGFEKEGGCLPALLRALGNTPCQSFCINGFWNH